MTALTDVLERCRLAVEKHKAKPPAPKRCKHCGSFECGPLRCRFSMESNVEHPGDRIVGMVAAFALVLIVTGVIA